MSYKTLLVHVGSDEQAADRLAAAFDIGARFGSTVIGVGAIAWDPFVDPTLGYVDGETIQILRDDVDIDIAAAQKTFAAAAKTYPHPVEWRPVMDYPAKTMNRLSCGADLIVAGRPPRRFDDRRLAPPTDLIMGSGLPVLLLPNGGKALEGRNVLVGWKNTRETRRAIADALPMLRVAERVYVVEVAENDAVGAGAAAELNDVVERLNRHGIFAEASLSPQVRATVAEDLADVADSRRCGMLVLGAYGHSRLREWAFGGVTSDLLAAGGRPILFSR